MGSASLPSEHETKTSHMTGSWYNPASLFLQNLFANRRTFSSTIGSSVVTTIGVVFVVGAGVVEVVVVVVVVVSVGFVGTVFVVVGFVVVVVVVVVFVVGG